MVLTTGIPNILIILGIVAAVVALAYFVLSGLRRDHATGDYHFTWGVGIVLLFLLGFVPGIVGLGLYLTVEKHYPIYWLVFCLLVGGSILLVAGTGVNTGIDATETMTGPPPSVWSEIPG